MRGLARTSDDRGRAVAVASTENQAPRLVRQPCFRLRCLMNTEPHVAKWFFGPLGRRSYEMWGICAMCGKRRVLIERHEAHSQFIGPGTDLY